MNNYNLMQNNISLEYDPVGIWLLEISNRNIRAMSEICSELTVKTPERR